MTAQQGTAPTAPYALFPPPSNPHRWATLVKKWTNPWTALAAAIFGYLVPSYLVALSHSFSWDERASNESNGSLTYAFTYVIVLWGLCWLVSKGTWPRLLIVAVLALNPLFLSAPGLGFMPPVILAFFCVVSVWRRLDPEAKLAPPAMCHQAIWGDPGGHVGQSERTFGDRAKSGASGEVLVGAMLTEVVRRYPFVRVFHGVKFEPDSTQPTDVDHLVLIGSQTYLIDAKMWQRNHLYSWSAADRVLRDGDIFPGGKVHMNAAHDLWDQYLAKRGHKVRPRTWIVLAQDGTVNNDRAGSVRLATRDQMFAHLSAEAERQRQNPFVDRRLMFDALAQRHA